MGNKPSSLPGDLAPGYVALELHHAGERGLFKSSKAYSIYTQNGQELYSAKYQNKCGSCHVLVKQLDLLRLVPDSKDPTPQEWTFAAGSGPLARDADVAGPGGKHICKVRRGSTFKFEYCGKFYRWQSRPSGSWFQRFPDHAMFKLMEAGADGRTVTAASLHFTSNPACGKGATLYMNAAEAADPDWQDLIVLLALVVMQQELTMRAHTVGGVYGTQYAYT